MRCLDDQLVYAVGDIHGRLDLLNVLIAELKQDLVREGKPGVFILLGDYIDRGPDSRGVVERVLCLVKETWVQALPLRGNHEQLLLDFIEQPENGSNWFALGGAATLASYGVPAQGRGPTRKDWVSVRDRLVECMPRAHRSLLGNLPFCVTAGDYFFVHAGVRRGRPLNAQRRTDMLWIRDSFLKEPTLGFGKVIVHGHSTSIDPMIERERIGIDTGAYATGVLTCLRLDGDRRDLISAESGGVSFTPLPVA